MLCAQVVAQAVHDMARGGPGIVVVAFLIPPMKTKK